MVWLHDNRGFIMSAVYHAAYSSWHTATSCSIELQCCVEFSRVPFWVALCRA